MYKTMWVNIRFGKIFLKTIHKTFFLSSLLSSSSKTQSFFIKVTISAKASLISSDDKSKIFIFFFVKSSFLFELLSRYSVSVKTFFVSPLTKIFRYVKDL